MTSLPKPPFFSRNHLTSILRNNDQLAKTVPNMTGQEPLTALFRAIVSIYFEEVTDEDREAISEIDLEEPSEIPLELAVPAIKVAAEDSSRLQALRFAYQNLQHVPTTIEDNLILLLIESLEYNELWSSGQYRTGIMRAASFYESFLIDECNLGPNNRLYDAIKSAADEDFLSEKEERVLQFLREIRNDCGHNAWLKNEYHQEVVMMACFAALTVTNSIRGGIVDNQLAEIGESPMERDSSSNLTPIVQNVESRYNWEWDEDQRRYDPVKNWSPPEDEDPYF